MSAASFAPLPVLLLPLLVYLQASLPNASSFKSASIIKFNPQRCIDLTLARRHPRLQTHDQFPFSFPVMSSTSSSEIIGGDYAGLSATFSSKTGELVPVPEHLVPESMLEWGEIPTNLEILSSEDWIANDDGAKSYEEFHQTTMTVMPEVGCGIDNLEITKRAEHFGSDDSRFENWRHQQQREVAAVDRRVGQKVDLETIFQVDSERDDDGKECPRRIRISLSLDMPQRTEENPTLSKLITLRVERQCSHQSSKGTAWSGPSSNSGGLDARTVMNTIGKDIVYGDVFSVKRTKGGGDLWDIDIDTVEEKDGAAKILDGAWKRAVISPKDDDFMMTKEGYSITFRLPQNVMVRYGASSEEMWGIEVSHFDTIGSDDKMCLRRRVVMRALPLKNGIGSVSYCMEEKEL